MDDQQYTHNNDEQHEGEETEKKGTMNSEQSDKTMGQEEISKQLENNKNQKKGFFSHKCKQCDEYKREIEEYKAGWQRATADYQNLVKEMDAKKSEYLAWSEQQILEEFLPVYDNFKKAFTTDFVDTDNTDNAKKWDNWKKGIGYIMQQFGTILKNHGIEEIKTVGELFNPEFHEAMSEEESDQPEHAIVREVDSGYMMKGKVVKVAKVIVSKKV